MTTAHDLATQKKQAIEQGHKADQLIVKEKALRHEQIAALDREIANLKGQRARAVADLSSFG